MPDPTTTPQPPEQELARATEPAPGAQVSQDTTPAQVTEPAKPQPKYTDEELSQRLASVKGGYEGTVKELKTINKQLKEQLAQIKEQAQQAEYTQLFTDLDAEPRMVNFAKKLQEDWKKLNTDRQKLDQQLEEWEPRLAELNEAGKRKKAYDLVKEHGLDESTTEELVKAENSGAMEIAALRLAIEKSKVAARLPAKPTGTTPSTQGRDLSKLSDSEKFGIALEEVTRNR